MNNNMQGYDNIKRIFAFVMGLVILGTSLYFSVEGFDFKVQNESIWWVGWVLAFAVTSSQFMFNTRPKELNWTIIILGLVAYGYSIWSNIMGFHSLRGTPSVMDWMNISGGIFMDVFPETAIAWALGAVKVGDLFGNIFSVLGNPDTVSQTNGQQSYAPHMKSGNVPNQNNEAISKLPKPIISDGTPHSFGDASNYTRHQLVNKQDGRHNKK